ncbi:hypothetical protein ABIA35_006393 [Catenulispora sp. MAP12-49]|uniref:hypothetical protein n=1 Tax=unclassified Catenulispora TaxID=414885 RepID=UPI003516105F
MDLALTASVFGRNAAMRRDLKLVERELAKSDEPEPEAIDLIPIWEELVAVLGVAAAGLDDDVVPAAVDRYVDAYIAEFMRRVDARHDARLGALDRLELKVAPHLARIHTLMRDEQFRIELLDAIITDQVIRVAATEEPPVFSPHRPDPPEQHR